LRGCEAVTWNVKCVGCDEGVDGPDPGYFVADSRRDTRRSLCGLDDVSGRAAVVID
jgi:hypothetical protein